MNNSISYIIPAYNCESTIIEAVNSILNGNWQPGDEVIIVNDASTDATAKVVSGLTKKNQSIRLINHKKNLGGASARNTAVKNANNPYIFCLDSDNILCHSSVRLLLNELQSKKYDAAAFEKIIYFRDNLKSISHEWTYKNKVYRSSNYLTTNIVPGASGNYLYTKNSWQIAGGYPEDSGALDTWGFGLRQVMHGMSIGVMPDSYYYHRIGSESYWIRDFKHTNVSERAFTILRPFLPQIRQKDVARIQSKEHRENWYEHLDQNPLKLKSMITIKNIINYLRSSI